jgi:hypothetical protein
MIRSFSPLRPDSTITGWIGIQDSPDDIRQWRGAILRELGKLGSSHSVDDLEISSMLHDRADEVRGGHDGGRAFCANAEKG